MKDKVYRWLAWHLPRKLVYWAFIKVAAFATTGQYGQTIVSELSALDALQRFEGKT